jgi:Icc-related predicted phosphoesterase
MTQYVCISDTHNKHRELEMPHGDILLHSGDISYASKGDILQEAKQLEDFSLWLGEQFYDHIVIIAGNHDFLFEKEEERAIEILTKHHPNVHYLNQTSVFLEGLKIYGEPRQPRFCNWAFNVDRPQMKAAWAKVPVDADIILSHGPPEGYGDLVEDDHGVSVFGDHDPFKHVGCRHLANLFDSGKSIHSPKLITFGHIHEGYGQWYKPKTNTRLVNASVCNEHYQTTNRPVVIEINH